MCFVWSARADALTIVLYEQFAMRLKNDEALADTVTVNIIVGIT